jgi:hypothetical protein
MKKKETRGGKREGAGRKPAQYKTKTLSFRVKLEILEKVKIAIKKQINQINNECN